MDEKPVTPDPDDDETLEGCVDKIEDGNQQDVTLDEDLPVAEGGVA
jgi:hypothetical protein